MIDTNSSVLRIGISRVPLASSLDVASLAVESGIFWGFDAPPRPAYENGKGGKAILFVTNRDFDTGIVKAKVMFLIDLQKGQGVREYVQERIADVASCEELSARPEYQEVDPGNYAGDFAFLGQMLEIQ